MSERDRALIGVSSGTASVLGLSRARAEVPPTTAYLLVGGRCQRNCAFCAQARESRAGAQALSRVNWPPFEQALVIEALVRAYAMGKVERACLQVTVDGNYFERTRELASVLGRRMPLCASIALENLAGVEKLLEAGVERVGLALDAATPQLYRQMKGGDWGEALALVERAAARFPGRIATHLIMGLGESEREMAQMLGLMHGWGVRVGLFAFTPIPGTRLAVRSQPPIGSYRRLQIAHYLLERGLSHTSEFAFSSDERIMEYGLSAERLWAVLESGDAFRTSGCPSCNRPYYNERPGGIMYNYPRPLHAQEVQKAIEEARGEEAKL